MNDCFFYSFLDLGVIQILAKFVINPLIKKKMGMFINLIGL